MAKPIKTILLTSLVIAGLIASGSLMTDSYANDKHAGYYYPEPQTTEIYKGRTAVYLEATELSRIAFVTALTQQALQSPYPPGFVIFAKGGESQKAIITALGSQRYNTIYRMRGLLAMLTSLSRTTPMFSQNPNSKDLTFLDMLHMMGFTQLTISDGDQVAHQIILE